MFLALQIWWVLQASLQQGDHFLIAVSYNDASIKHKYFNGNTVGWKCVVMTAYIATETEAKLWPYIWARGNDTGVQTTAQEKEKAC